MFSGLGQSLNYDDVYIAKYYEYLESKGFDFTTIDLSTLKNHSLILTDQDGKPRGERYSIFKCLIFDTSFNGSTYHLCEGGWYKVEDDYIIKLKSYLDPLCQDTTLLEYNHKDEAEFNAATCEGAAGRICLDKTNISPDGQKQIEPCDIIELDGEVVNLHHVKISTLSGQLSHLFNQGANSVATLRDNEESVEKLKKLVEAASVEKQRDEIVHLIDAAKFRIFFQIITHKDKAGKSDNLPLFSRISLMRCMKDIKRMGIPASYSFVRDVSPPKPGTKKVRAKKVPK